MFKNRELFKVKPSPLLIAGSLQFDLKLKSYKMQFEGALVKEQGVTFAIVVVKAHVLNSSSGTNSARTAFSRYFPGVPIILMAQDGKGVPSFEGRRDIVQFLSSISLSRIPWKKYTVN